MCFKLPESITAQNGNTHNLPGTWYLYIVENRLGHLYTGITTNPQRRIKQHNGLLAGGAKALKGKAPIVYKVLIYYPSAYVSNVTGWLIVSVSLAIALHLLVLFSKKVILFGMNFRQEVDQQHNVGVAALGFTLSIGTAMIINGVLGS